ncbi:MAG: hypothetical protein HeimC3_26300 [Candidatus Heimdallarchaeota archaeon LC_3]|nr:MAG: hypothetical protein HeimC3_26300 [Candidatus Heimdallarchaeota archaeon LC_3]
MDEPTLKRLAFIKFIFRTGVEFSSKLTPYNSISLLHFHDSIEMFLKLSIDYNGDFSTISKDLGIPKLMEKIDEKIKENDPTSSLSYSGLMTLNSARNKFKHTGMIPASIDIETYRSNASTFFLENCKILFSIEFSEISMAHLIFNEEIRNEINDAEEKFNNSLVDEALEKLAMGFAIALILFNEKKKLFGFYSSTNSVSISWDYDNKELDLHDLESFSDDVHVEFENIYEILNIFLLNLDYPSYYKFKYVTPEITYHRREKKFITKVKNWEIPPDDSDFQFCISFVIDAIIKIENSLKSFEKLPKLKSRILDF